MLDNYLNKMSDVIVLPPSGTPLLRQCVTKSAQKTKRKEETMCVLVFYLNMIKLNQSCIV